MSIYRDKNKTKDGRSYFFQVMKDGELYKSKRFITREEARKAEAVFLLQKNKPSSKKFEVVASSYFDYLKTYCKYSTIYTFIKDYNKHIRPYFARFDISNINIPTYNVWYEEMSKKGLSTKYLNKINSLLKNIFNYAIQSYGLEFNPVVKTFKASKEKIVTEKLRYITKDEFDKFVSVIDEPMYYLLFNVLFYTGLRKGELLCLTWRDVNLDKKYLSITKTLYKIHNNAPTSNKTASNREIYLDNSLVRLLADYRASKMCYKDFSLDWYVFGDVFTLSTSTLERKKHQYFLQSGVREITIHEFRHSHVSNMINLYLKNNTSSTKFFIMMSQRLGHTIGVMQKTYMHLFPNTQDEIVDLINNS